MKKIISVIINFIFAPFKTQNNKIIFEAARDRIDGNPKAIYEYINNNCSDEFKTVWIVSKNTDVSLLKRGQYCYYRSLMSFYHLATATYVFSSQSNGSIFKKKPGQIYIQTWHGGGAFKKCGYDCLVQDEKPRMEYTEMWDYFLASDEYNASMIKTSCSYDGIVKVLGLARSDEIINNRDKKLVLNSIGINNEKLKKTIILYAPTFREEDLLNDKVEIPLLSLGKLKSSIVLIRLHPLLNGKIDTTKFPDNFINVTDYPDIQDLLKISDILITDYSSVIFDFALLNKPMIFYAYDIEKYMQERGGFYLNYYDDLPGQIVKTEKQLLACLTSKSYLVNFKKIGVFNKKYNNLNDGNVCKRIVDEIRNDGFLLQEKKISVIMPTYNDADTICETLDSLIIQTHKNWELIIVDDGSVDQTRTVIADYIKTNHLENKITYVYQENTDQLNAIILGTKYINGDFVYILHSDDLLFDENVFKNAIHYFSASHKLDAIMADLDVIDKNSIVVGKQKVLKYKKSVSIPPLQLLWLGRNLYVDVAFHTKASFTTNVYNNYLKWNTPFWLSTEPNIKMLNIDKVPFTFLKYRVYDDNYINNNLGKLNVVNGELRIVTRLMNYYTIPCYKLQYMMFRVFHKLKIDFLFKTIYLNKPTINKAKIINFILEKRFNPGYDNAYLVALTNFYKASSTRTITIKNISDKEKIYIGSDMRKFNKALLNNELSPLYMNLFKEMNNGFNKIVTSSDESKEKIETIVKFLNIYPYVEVEKK